MVISQMKNLVSLVNASNLILIYNNTFLQNSVIKGVIYIAGGSRVQPVIVSKNYFATNAAYFGAAAIFIRSRATVPFLSMLP